MRVWVEISRAVFNSETGAGELDAGLGIPLPISIEKQAREHLVQVGVEVSRASFDLETGAGAVGGRLGEG